MKRNSAYDLMKILSMFLIVLYHVILHGQVLTNVSNPTLKFIVQMIYLFCFVHVNSFVLVMGYYQCERNFKSSKVWHLINISMFYKILILFIGVFILEHNFNVLYIFRQLFPFNLDEYWFIKIYLILYCISPYLNILIQHIKKRQFQKLLLILFFFFSLLPFVTGNEGFSNNGYSLSQFVLLYFLGAYFRKYPVEKSYIGKKVSKEFLRLSFIFICLGSLILNFCIMTTAGVYVETNSIFNEVLSNMIGMSLFYSNPLILIQSVAYFLFFGTYKFSKTWIYKISSLTLGVYLLHDHTFIRGILYIKTNIVQENISSFTFLINIFLVSICIFVVGLIVEYIRQKVFRFIYQRKISKNIRERYHQYIKRLKTIA